MLPSLSEKPDFPRPRALFEARVEDAKPSVNGKRIGETSLSGTLVVSRRELRARGTLLVPGPPRTLARVPNVRGEEARGGIGLRPRLSPDGTRLALSFGQGRTHPVLILDAATGKVLDRGVSEGRPEYGWSPDSRTLAIAAPSRDGSRANVYTLGGSLGIGTGPRLVRRDTSRFLWSQRGLITALWLPKERAGSGGENPRLEIHVGGKTRALTSGEAERLLGAPGAGPSLWAPNPELATEILPFPEGRGLLLVGGIQELGQQEGTLPDGSRILGTGAGPTQSVDTIYRGGPPTRISHPAFYGSERGAEVVRGWNLGHGVFAYASTGDFFVRDDGQRAVLAAIRLPKRERRYWRGLKVSRWEDAEILWR